MTNDTLDTFAYTTPDRPVRASAMPAVVRAQGERNIDLTGFDPALGLAQHFDVDNTVGTPRQSTPQASTSPESVSESDSGVYFTP